MGLQDETRDTSLACRRFSSPHSATSFVGAHPLNRKIEIPQEKQFAYNND
jgi:hypothetical protein